jgi:hypothetical protein
MNENTFLVFSFYWLNVAELSLFVPEIIWFFLNRILIGVINNYNFMLNSHKNQKLYNLWGNYSNAMVTSIQISEELKEKLSKRKMSKKDTYEDVIWDLLEDTLELSDETKKDIEIARKEYKEGKYITHAELKKELGI